MTLEDRATDIIAFCRKLAECTEVAGQTTRTFLSPAMRAAYDLTSAGMMDAGLTVHLDAAGNLRGVHGGPRRVVIGSHLDTVPNAGAFDGVLGVALGIALAAETRERPSNCGIEIIAFSEEEGIRFGVPFIGSRAVVGKLDAELLMKSDRAGVTVARAIREFGLPVEELPAAVLDSNALAYLEFHIEQGPVLESLGFELGTVEAVAGQTRMQFRFQGRANHAGTTPMHLREDALAAAAEWILAVEREALATPQLVATVGRVEAYPGVGNVIAGEVLCSLDLRHPDDSVRHSARQRIEAAARSRGLNVEWKTLLDQPAVAMNPEMIARLEKATRRAGFTPHRLVSGAGHDAMIVASRIPAGMLFLRSPGGISHHPDETVLHGDVVAALRTALHFLEGYDDIV